MLNPFVNLLASLLQLYMYCVIAQAVLSTLISFKVVNGGLPIMRRIMYTLDRLVEPALRPIRKFLPDLGGVDVSPIILFLLIQFASSSLYTYLYNL